jgi:hydroxyacylglutathione hydrolase
MIVERVTVGVNEANCYLVAKDKRCQGAIIDPGDEPQVILERCSLLGVSVATILITHCHWDHIGAVREIKEQTSAQICCHRDGLPFYEALVEQLAFVGMSGQPAPAVDRFVTDNEIIEVGGVLFTVLHTPGHSPGSVSYLVDGALFCGDVLFEGGGVGRTDLPGGDARQLKSSITNRIFSLPADTVLYPGHGPQTTVEKERASGLLFL